jgi:hypothetical protein
MNDDDQNQITDNKPGAQNADSGNGGNQNEGP